MIEVAKKVLNSIIIVVLFFTGIYLGIGGMGISEYNSQITDLENSHIFDSDSVHFKVNDISYTNQTYQIDKLQDQRSKFLIIYPWIESLPDLITLIITCCAFSMVGSFIVFFRRLSLNRRGNSGVLIVANLISAFLTGFVVLGLSYVLPVVLSRDSDQTRPITLMFLSLFAGMYSNKFYDKLAAYFDDFQWIEKK